MSFVVAHPSVVTQATSGNTSWTNLDNVLASSPADDPATAAMFKDGDRTRVARATGFGVVLPPNTAVVGIEARIRRAGSSSIGSSGRSVDHTVRLIVGGSLVGNNLAIATAHPTTSNHSRVDFQDYGSPTSTWGVALSKSDVENADFGIAFAAQESSTSVTARLYQIELIVHYELLNVPPEITVPPIVGYFGRTRLGPHNTPGGVTFRADDADNDPLTYEIRTAADGGGTLTLSGNANTGTPTGVPLPHDAPGMIEGTNTLYLRVSDGIASSADAPFTVLVDRTPPTVGPVIAIPYPEPVLYFDGASQIVIPNTDNRLQPAQAFTWEMWFKLDSYTQYNTLMGFASNAMDFGRMDATTQFRCHIYTWNGSQAFVDPSGFPSVDDGAWHHMAIVWDGATGERFALIDGIRRHYAAMTPGIQVSNTAGTNFTIGAVSNSRFITGWIKDVRLWNVARTEQEIVATMHRYLSGEEPGLLAFYPLNEGIGNVAHDLANGYDGEIIGASWPAPAVEDD